MALEYLSLFPDMRRDHFDALTAEEVGIIVLAALDYIGDGTLPDFELRSVLDLTWRRVKRHIDACAAKVDKMSALGKAGGEASANKRKQARASESQAEASEAEANASDHEAKATNNKYQKQMQMQKQMQKQEVVEEYGREPAPAAAENVIAFDGQDLTADIERNHEADALVMRYGLSKDYATRERLLEDLEKYGSAKLREALEKAVDGNQKERITPNFWRAILAGKGRDSPTNNGVGYGQVLTQREYTPEEFKVMEVDISAIDSHGRLPGELGYGT